MESMHGGMMFRPGRPIRISPPPDVLPACRLHIRCPTRPEVVSGQKVEAGQALATPTDEFPFTRISPVTGTIVAVEADHSDSIGDDDTIFTAPPDSFRISIQPTGDSMTTSIAVAPPSLNGLQCWLTELSRRGAWTDSDPATQLPCHGLINQLMQVQKQRPDALLGNGLDAYPSVADHTSLLMSFSRAAVQGLAILAEIAQVSQPKLIVPAGSPAVRRLRAAAKGTSVRIVPVQPRYPASSTTMLAYMHAGKRVPSHVNPMDHRLLIAQPWTLIRIGRWVHEGKLDVARPLIAAEPDTEQPLEVHWAIPGMPLSHASESLGKRMRSNDHVVLAGHPLTGRELNWPIADDIGPLIGERGLTLTVLRNLGMPKPEACISTGWCVDVCPTELQPYLLMQKVVHHPRRRLLAELQWCIECGLCSHACPSAVDLAGTLREAKWRYLRQPAPDSETT